MRDTSNNPIFELQSPLQFKRNDNTLVIAEHIIKEIDVNGDLVVVGQSEGLLTFMVREANGRATCYTLAVEPLVEKMLSNHRLWSGVPRLRPVTTADREVEEEELREPTEQELADAQADVPPPIIGRAS